jgi:hypothetical protein
MDDHASLPKIAIVGDKSSGKTSIFSALTGLTFPRGRFPTTTFPIHVHSRQVAAEEAHRVRAYILPGLSDSRYTAAMEHLSKFDVTHDGPVTEGLFVSIVEQVNGFLSGLTVLP